jgi:hypothetical protein
VAKAAIRQFDGDKEISKDIGGCLRNAREAAGFI